MNRTELIDALSADTGLTRQQSEAAIDAIVYEITSGVRAGNPVRITGFGTFKLRERAARKGRNPQTGAPVRIKASKGIGFTPGVKLKADLNARAAVPKPKGMVAAQAAAKATTTRAGAAKKAAAKATTTRAGAAKKAAAKATTARAGAAKKATKATRATKATKAPAKRSARR